jgi:hypothetical protein
MRWAGDVRNPYRVLVGKPDERRPLGRIVRREEIRVESCVKYDGRDWSHLARNEDHWHAVVNTVMNLPGSVKDDNFLSCRTICWLLRENYTWDLSRKARLYECVDELSGLLEPSRLILRELLVAVR